MLLAAAVAIRAIDSTWPSQLLPSYRRQAPGPIHSSNLPLSTKAPSAHTHAHLSGPENNTSDQETLALIMASQPKTRCPASLAWGNAAHPLTRLPFPCVGKVGQQEPSYAADGNVEWCGYFGIQFGSFLMFLQGVLVLFLEGGVCWYFMVQVISPCLCRLWVQRLACGTSLSVPSRGAETDPCGVLGSVLSRAAGPGSTGVYTNPWVQVRL